MPKAWAPSSMPAGRFCTPARVRTGRRPRVPRPIGCVARSTRLGPPRQVQLRRTEPRHYDTAMSTAKFVEVHVGDVVRLRKTHACGGTDWSVVRLGADIGLRCATCQHRVL